jgi:hypothetical protein
MCHTSSPIALDEEINEINDANEVRLVKFLISKNNVITYVRKINILTITNTRVLLLNAIQKWQ